MSFGTTATEFELANTTDRSRVARTVLPSPSVSSTAIVFEPLENRPLRGRPSQAPTPSALFTMH
jgi:hypothetical protein